MHFQTLKANSKFNCIFARCKFMVMATPYTDAGYQHVIMFTATSRRHGPPGTESQSNRSNGTRPECYDQIDGWYVD